MQEDDQWHPSSAHRLLGNVDEYIIVKRIQLVLARMIGSRARRYLVWAHGQALGGLGEQHRMTGATSALGNETAYDDKTR
jgi:hypothetical protein